MASRNSAYAHQVDSDVAANYAPVASRWKTSVERANGNWLTLRQYSPTSDTSRHCSATPMALGYGPKEHSNAGRRNAANTPPASAGGEPLETPRERQSILVKPDAFTNPLPHRRHMLAENALRAVATRCRVTPAA